MLFRYNEEYLDIYDLELNDIENPLFVSEYKNFIFTIKKVSILG